MATSIFEMQHFSGWREQVEQAIARHRGWYVFQGIIFVLAGFAAVILPGLTALGFELVIGTLLILSGLVQGYASLRSETHWWSLISSIASLVVGGLMLFHPVVGTIALATVIAAFLAVEGIAEILLAFQFRPTRGWGWLLFSGGISLLLSMLLFAGWPAATVWFLGIVIGINLLLYGVSLLALTISADQETQQRTTYGGTG